MTAAATEQPTHDDQQQADETALINEQIANNQLLLSGKFVIHTPKAGLNPLADAAAYLFSVMGKLKQIKSYRNLAVLRQELIQEINIFQDLAKAHGYSSDYITLARYAVCATLDDIIANTAWGSQAQWNNYSLLTTFSHGVFNQEPLNQERFFIILGRLIKEPALYIDIMEFMYICLSLGFRGHFRSTEFNKAQLEQITHSLYKHIRAYRGDFSKTLSPLLVKSSGATTSFSATPNGKKPVWLSILLVVSVTLALFAGARYILDNTSHQAYQDLIKTGKSTSL